MQSSKSLYANGEVILSPDETEARIDTQLNTPSQKCCIKGDVYYHVKLIFLSAAFYFLSVGLASVSLVFLINERIAGDAADPNHMSVLVQTSVVFIHNSCSFIFHRYSSGMGDYLGRKPVLCFSTVGLIVTRLLYAHSYRPYHFLITAIFSGAADCYYYTSIAWLSDIFHNHAERSKHIGLYAGIAGFSGIVIGSPAGAALSIKVSPASPFLFAALSSCVSLLILFFNPCHDTDTLDHKHESEYVKFGKRALPRDVKSFLKRNFPLSPGSLKIVKSSHNPLDWVTFGLAQWTLAILPLVLVQFLLKVYNWSRAITSLTLVAIGLSLGLLVPALQNRYDPVPLAFYSLASQAVGFLCLSISGTGFEDNEIIGIVGLVLLALGLSWIPCSQSIIISGYSFGEQGMKLLQVRAINYIVLCELNIGVVSGLVGQLNDFAVFPAYAISLSFTFNLDRGDGAVYWPGCAFGIVSFAIHSLKHCHIWLWFTAQASAILCISLMIHRHVYGEAAFVLTRRHLFKNGVDVEIPNNTVVPINSSESSRSLICEEDGDEDVVTETLRDDGITLRGESLMESIAAEEI